MLDIVIALLLGILAGTFTGLIPGVHINLISIILLSFAGLLFEIAPPLAIASFIVAMSITHNSLDSIPSVFLGAPDSSMVMGMLPGHRMLMEGRGYEAVKLTVIGSLCCLIITLLLIPIAIPVLPTLVGFITPYIAWILIVIIGFMLVKDWNRKVIWNFLIFFLAGSLGMLVLNFPNVKQPLLPMLSGLFGVSGLLLSLQSASVIPTQVISETVVVTKRNTVKAFSGAVVAGSFTGIFPGLGSAQAAIIAMQIVGNIGENAFMIMIGGINTVNFTFSLATFYALSKARNGSIIAVMELMKSVRLVDIAVFGMVALLSGCIAAFLALRITRVFAAIVPKLNYRFLCFSVIGFVTILVLYFSSWIGLVILVVSTCLGMLPQLLGVNRSHAMGCLLLPVILFFLL